MKLFYYKLKILKLEEFNEHDVSEKREVLFESRLSHVSVDPIKINYQQRKGLHV